MGYTFETLRERTYPELNTLQLGYMVRQEREADARRAAGGGHSTRSERRKRQHKQSIRDRLRSN